MRRASLPIRRAFSLIEVVISTAIVGMLMVAALKAQSELTRSRQKFGDRGQALLMAQDLMAEILATNYKELVETPTFGPEPTETGGTRANFDDVDDFNGWNATPPQNSDGSVIANRTGWRQQVTVEYVDPLNANTTVGTDQGAKRITVTISKNSVTLATLIAVRTAGWQQPPYDVPP
jgi:MSHA pilin protein MshD